MKRLILFLFLALPAFGQGSFYQLPVPLPNAIVRVCPTPPSGNPCASPSSIFSDQALTQGIANPFPVGSTGNFGFWVAAGQYTIQIGQPYNFVYTVSLGGGGGSTSFGALTPGTNTGALVIGTGGSLSTSGSGTIAATSATNATTASNVLFSGVGAATNGNALVTGPGGSHTPSGTGQINSGGNWVPFAQGALWPGTPTLTVTNTGGSVVQNSSIYVRLTFVGLATVVPSAEVLLQTNATTGCTSSSCTMTVTMPTNCTAGNLPAGVTGCTVWDTATAGVNQEKQQAAANNCVNITTATCTVTTIGAGALLSSVVSATAGVTPVNPQTGSTPDLILPTSWFTAGNTNNYPLAGIDTTALNFLACCWTANPITPPTKQGSSPGVFTFVDNVFFNDDVNPPPISNTFISIKHESGASTATLTNSGANGLDDRALSIRIDNDLTSNPFYEQYLVQYNEDYVDNNNTTCAPIGYGFPWGEACTGSRFITSDRRATATNSMQMIGVSADANAGANTTQGGDTLSVIGIQGGAYTANNYVMSGNVAFAGGYFGANNSGGATGAGIGFAAYLKAPQARFPSENVGLQIEDFGSNSVDWNMVSATTTPATQGNNLLQGKVWLPSIETALGTIGITGSLGVTGGLTTTQHTAPTISSISNGGTPGVVTATYKATCQDSTGAETGASVSSSTNTANANLTGTNFNTVNFGSNLNGCASYGIYRTVDASNCNGVACTNGKIGTVVPLQVNILRANSASFNDTGQVGDGNTAVAQANTTGGIVTAAGSTSHLAGNIAQVGPSGFTTANNTSLQTITGLTFNLPDYTAVWSFHCSLTYSQATANVAVAFGIQAATFNPTNIFATGNQQITVGPPATFVTGTLPTLATTTATNIVSGTPGATATNYWVTLDGTIESTGTNVINWMTSTATGTDAVTVLRGSYCRLF